MHRRFFIFVVAALLFRPSLAAQDEKKPEGPRDLGTTKSNASIKRIRMQPQSVKLVHSVKAVYPQTAQEKKIQGAVRLDIVIGTDGKVLQAKVISGDPLLAESAVAAVRKWKYERTTIKGEPVEVSMFVDIIFMNFH